jgi:toxin ParE1/3/4
MKVIWGLRAKRDLHELIAYLLDRSLQGTENVAARIQSSTELLGRMPHAGRLGRIQGSREMVVSNTPYILAYRIVSGRVRILRVYHSARRWPLRMD